MSMIPYATGTPIPVYMDPNQHPYSLGFGLHGEYPHPLIGGELEVTHGLLHAFPFYIARDAVVTDIGMSMIIMETIELGTASANMYAQLFYKRQFGNFIAIPETKVVLTPTVTGSIIQGQLFEKMVNNLNVPVAAGSRLLLIIHKDVIQANESMSFVAMMGGSVYFKHP